MNQTYNGFGPNEPGMPEIREIGSDAVPFLIEAINHKPGLSTWHAYGNIYTNMPRLIAQKMPEPRNATILPFRAYCALGELGSSARSAVPFLASQFTTNNNCVDFDRATLMKLGTNAVDAIPALTNAFHSSDRWLRLSAGRALSVICPEYPELVPTLLEKFHGTNIVERRFACICFSEMKSHSPEINAALQEALKDPDYSVRYHAQRALKPKSD